MTRTANVDRDSAEWKAMWSALGKACDAAYRDNGETWQYMGSCDKGQGCVHQFRHRSYFGKRVYLDVKASASWAPATFGEYDLESIQY